MSVQALSLVRFLGMAALLVPYCVWRKESLRFRTPTDAWRILSVGFMSMGVYMILFIEGLGRTGAAEAAIVLATAPIFTYLLSCLVKQERFHTGALVGALIAFTGVSLVILGGAQGGGGTLAGDLLVLASSFAWATATVMMRPLLDRYTPTQVFTMSLPGGLPLMLLYGGAAAWATDFGKVTPFGWLMFAHITVLSGVVAFICFYTGLRQIGASRATLYQFFVPPTAALGGWLIMGTTLRPLQYAGLLIVLAGVFYASRVRALASARTAKVAA
jgi:drug/metabolite transporter (DMT)-like permease